MQFGEKERAGLFGEYLVASRFVGEFGWPYRMQPIADLGIDGEVELLDPAGHSLGKTLKVQVKTWESDKNSIYVKKKHFEYWLLLGVPVVLCHVDVSSSAISWWPLSAARQTTAQVAFDFDKAKKLDSSIRAELEAAAKPQTIRLFEGFADVISNETAAVVGLHHSEALADRSLYKRLERIRELGITALNFFRLLREVGLEVAKDANLDLVDARIKEELRVARQWEQQAQQYDWD